MPYTVRFNSSANRELRKLDPQVRRRVEPRVLALEDDPRPHGSKKLTDREVYRIRVGDHRVIYSIDDARRLIEITQVADRRDVYDR